MIPQLSIVIPLLNEQDSIPFLYQRLIETLESQYIFELIFIDDGSTDKTFETLQQITKHDKRCKLIQLKRNYGQTAAITAGIDHAIGEIIIPMDGDLQNPPEEIPKLVKKLSEGFDVCSGWRKNRQDTFWSRKLPSLFANKLISRISGVELHDYGCTLKAYKKEILDNVQLYGEMHRFIPIYASLAGAKITEIPVEHDARKFGQSKYGINRTIKVILDLTVVKFLSKYSQKPIYLFGGFGLLNFIAAILTFCWMLYYKFWGDKSFIETPLPLLVALFILMGVLSILLGLITELLNRTYHESQDKTTYLIKEYVENTNE